jgi:hypothetical protein
MCVYNIKLIPKNKYKTAANEGVYGKPRFYTSWKILNGQQLNKFHLTNGVHSLTNFAQIQAFGVGKLWVLIGRS